VDLSTATLAAVAAPAAVTAATTTSAISAAAVTATTATISTTSTPTSAAWTWLTRTRLIYCERTAFDRLAVKVGDCLLGIGFGAHGDKCEAARFAGELVLHQGDFLDCARLGKKILKISFGGVEGKISYV
jgi:hypothetical protein